MHAMPVLIGVLCAMAIAYRYYSAFVAARVACLDDARVTPAARLADGQDYEPTTKWVLFGHHFAAISGAGPLIGPVLAAQFGYLPGLLWIVIGVTLGGAVQDMLVLALSTRRGGRSLARLAFDELGPTAGWAASVALLFIIVITLGGLGKVVVKALGGETVAAPGGGTTVVPGSSWGTFTIAMTIPIAVAVGLYLRRFRRGRVVEASLIGGGLTLLATVAGGWVADHPVGRYFSLSQGGVTWAMAAYGFVAAVLPVWVLLVPRDYLSSFLKIGTIAALVVGVVVANPKLEAPAVNHAFLAGGPTVPGRVFPFLFVTVMCGAISGFHALVASGTTPKMVARETDIRTIGYGAMLLEALVGVVALIAAATLPVGDWAAMNTDLARAPAFHDRLVSIGADVDHLAVYEDRTHESLRGRTGGAVTLAVGMAQVFDSVARRAGVVGDGAVRALWRYWYHFAIMFEALFILTTIDAGTRIGRFLLQDVAGQVYAPLGRTDWWPGVIASTAVIVAAWAMFLSSGSFAAIWATFGVANQMLAVIALAVVSAGLVGAGRGRYLAVTLVPLCVVLTTTTTAALELVGYQVVGLRTAWAKAAWTAADRAAVAAAGLTGGLILLLLACTAVVLAATARRLMARPAAGATAATGTR